MRIAFMLAMIFCVGCSGVPEPTARVQRVSLAEQTEQGGRVKFTLTLENASSTQLPIRETQYRVAIDGVDDVFTFTDRTPATIPADGDQTLTLPAAFPGDLTGRRYVVDGSVIYEPPGEFRRLLTESGIPLPSAKFSATGVLASDDLR